VRVRQEPGLNHLDVVCALRVQLAAQGRQHHRRDVDGDDAGTQGRHGERELARARTDVNDNRVRTEAQAAQQSDFLGRAGVLLAVVARDVGRIEVLPTRACDLVQHPARKHSACSHRVILPTAPRASLLPTDVFRQPIVNRCSRSAADVKRRGPCPRVRSYASGRT
jgi:hypothetical protein